MADLESIVQNPDFVARFWSLVQKTDSCWLWQGGRDRDGYGKLKRIHGQKAYTLAAHRVSAAIALSDFSPALKVRHKCDNPACCNPAHLEMGTQADNIRDRELRGRGNHEAKRPHLQALADSRRGVPRALWPTLRCTAG